MPGDATTQAAVLFQEGRAHLYSSRYAEARRIFEEIRRLGRDSGSPRIEMKPGSAYTMALCCQGLFGETLAFLNPGNVDGYKGAGSVIDYISGLGWIGYASCQVGPGDAGLAHAHRSVQEAEHVQSPIYLGGAHVWRSHALMALRRHDEAIADAQRCLELSRLHGVPYLGWHALVFLALCQCRRDDFEAADASLAQARTLLVRIEDGQWTLVDYLPAIEAEIACFRGDDARALAAAEVAIEIAAARGGCYAQALGWRIKAIVQLRGGADPALAQASFERALRLFEQGQANAERTYATLVWAHALQRAGHAELAREQIALAQELSRRHAVVLARCEHGASAML
jgi:tetratricopeptide (TPR) repeat protein